MAMKPTDDDGWNDSGDDSSAPGGEDEAKDADLAVLVGAKKVVVAASDEAGKEAEAAKAITAPKSEIPAKSEKPAMSEKMAAKAEAATAKASAKEKKAAKLAAREAKREAKKNRATRTPLLSAKQRRNVIVGGVGVVLVGAFVVTSELNSRHLYVSCGEDTVRAERGRFFPWGQTPLSGDKWKPVEIVDECADRELASELELEGVFLDLVLTHANNKLASEPPTEVDRAAELLAQASRLARDPSRGGARDEIVRLENDIVVWRASGDVDAALVALGRAQANLGEAVGKTQHAKNVEDRADFLRRLIEIAKSGSIPDLGAPSGPSAGAGKPPAPSTAAAGDGATAAATEPSDADQPSAASAPLPVPAGGVLL